MEAKRDHHVGTVTSSRDVHSIVAMASVESTRPVGETQPGLLL